MKTLTEIESRIEETINNYNALVDSIGVTSISSEGKLRMEALHEIDREITFSDTTEELIIGLEDNIARNKYSYELAKLINNYIKNTILK